MPNIILFDLDDTILDFHKSEKAALTNTMSQLGVTVTEQNISLYSEINDSMWKKLERGELTRAQVLLNRFEEFFNAIDVDCKPTEAKKLYERSLSKQCFFIHGTTWRQYDPITIFQGFYQLVLAVVPPPHYYRFAG